MAGNQYNFRFRWLRNKLKPSGRLPDGRWFYGKAPELLPFKAQRAFYWFMSRIGNPILNAVFGYKRLSPHIFHKKRLWLETNTKQILDKLIS